MQRMYLLKDTFLEFLKYFSTFGIKLSQKSNNQEWKVLVTKRE